MNNTDERLLKNCKYFEQGYHQMAAPPKITPQRYKLF